jgi:hypothetical protein
MVPVYDLDLNTIKHTLVAGTFARSIHTFPLDSLQLNENSSTFTPNGYAQPTFQISPNPASNQAFIAVEHLKSSQTVELVIADLSGRTVFRKPFKGFGRHEEMLDLQDIPQGVYVVYLRSGAQIWGARKWIVAKA